MEVERREFVLSVKFWIFFVIRCSGRMLVFFRNGFGELWVLSIRRGRGWGYGDMSKWKLSERLWK